MKPSLPLLAALLSSQLLVPGISHAQSSMLLSPPCTGAVHPAYGAPGDPLNIQVLIDEDLKEGWAPFACTGWKAGPAKIVMAAAGRFHHEGDSTVLIQRIARVSELKRILYWSGSRNVWRKLFGDAWALMGPKKSLRRDDFTKDEIKDGPVFHYYNEENNLIRGVVYQATIRDRRPDRFVLESTNVSAMGLAIFDAVAPGAFQQLYYLQRESPKVWRYYTLIRITEASAFAGLSAKSFKNRAVAYYRFLAGIQMDKEPPAAR